MLLSFFRVSSCRQCNLDDILWAGVSFKYCIWISSFDKGSWVILHAFLSSADFSFQVNFFKKFFQEYHKSDKQSGSKLVATVIRRQQKFPLVGKEFLNSDDKKNIKNYPVGRDKQTCVVS